MLARLTARPVPLPCQGRRLHQDPHSCALHQTVVGTSGQLMAYDGHVLALKDQQDGSQTSLGLKRNVLVGHV